MKRLQLKSIFLSATFLFTTSLLSQDWVSKMQDPSVNFFEVQKTFNEYVVNYKANYKQANGTEPARIPGLKLYKRWEHFMEPRVSPTGERFDPSIVWQEMKKYQEQYGTFGAGNWILIGPTNSIPAGGGGSGRTNFVTQHPTNPSIIWTGSPSGGLWKSSDAGATWTTNTDNVAQVIGCSDLAIDPVNPNIMYLATGDGDGGDTYTVGILKTTDGGTTWNTTSFSFISANYRQTYKIIIDPTNTNVLLVATTAGIYRSTNAGATFTLTQSGSFRDIEFKPGTPATVYAVGTEYFRSVNNGVTWTKIITAPLPASSQVSRMALAVSAANPNYVYILAANPAASPGYGFQGIYQSVNSGVTFTKKTTTPANIMCWVSSGTDVAAGGQGFYDLAFAASPTDAQEIIVGGINVWRSTNGGTSFNIVSHWAGSGAPYVHADQHELEYVNGTTFFSANDGGLNKTINSGAVWTDLSQGLQIAQMYGFGQSATNPNLFLTGWQDNGTNHYNGSTWSYRLPGDGGLAFISHANDQIQWGCFQFGSFNRSTDGGVNFSSCTSGITEYNGSTGPGPFIAEWNEDLTTANTLYAGFTNVWKSTNGGASWTQLGTVSTSTAYVNAIAAAPTTNGQVILASKGGTLYRTTNGGTNWAQVAGPPGGIIDIAFHPTNPNKAWITYSGFIATTKVYQTTNQGVTWTNISASLPNIPVNCITVDKNGNDALYIGTDAGVFFKDASMTIWQPFFQGLPKVRVYQLELFYSGNKIRAATFGRGLWESSLYTPGAYAPEANFTGNNFIGCPGLGVQYTDYSAGSPTSWNWSFPGGTPLTSTAQNPFVVYNTPGTFSVSLTSMNGNGTDTQTNGSYISISSTPSAPPTAAGKTMCGPATVTLTATPAAPGTVRWWNQPAGGSVLATGNTYAPSVNGTTSFYVDEAFPASGIDFIGALDKSMGGGMNFTGNDIRGLYFDVFKPVVINTVKVYAQNAGPRTIEIIDSNGNLVSDTTVNIPASPTNPATVTINRTVYPGTNYFIKFRGTVDAFRNSDGASYPYVDGGSNAITITGSNATDQYYYFFYDWQFTNIVCNTGRTTVVVTDTCSLTGVKDLFANGTLEIYPNPNNGQFTISFNVEKQDNYTVKISNTIGQSVYEETLQGFSGKYEKRMDIENYGKGVYMLSVTNSKNETVKKVMVY